MTDSSGKLSLQDLHAQVCVHLSEVYTGPDIYGLADRLIAALAPESKQVPCAPRTKWDQSDVFLITYGNSIEREGEWPLATLSAFVNDHLDDTISGIHVLPFFPYSSDDGFAVINYLQVNDSLGSWDDIEHLAGKHKLMADLVINHVSSRSQWFENFRNDTDPGRNYFITCVKDTDLSQVVRPRPSPLLRRVETRAGERHVWCTFGPDQVDLNFANPEVLVEFVGIMARYLEAGVSVLRLDAIAFLWKRIGTDCLHLKETHEIVKLLRVLAEFKRPDAILITETNVPNRQNLTYFGNGNEAHAIYNFSLPPLLVHALLSGNCRHLKTWMMSMPPAQTGTFYLNFIASHDGIGLRPAEGLLEDEELENFLNAIDRFGGQVSMRADSTGQLRAYEANISLWDALRGRSDCDNDAYQLARFVCAHSIMLGLEGVPAIYLHCFLGTGNDYERVASSGHYRSINRHVWDAEKLENLLDNPETHEAKVLFELRRIIEVRRRQPAFHPNAVQFTMHLGLEIFAFWRQSIDRTQSIFCISNMTHRSQSVALSDVNLIALDGWIDLLTQTRYDDLSARVELKPYQTLWLSNRDGKRRIEPPPNQA